MTPPKDSTPRGHEPVQGSDTHAGPILVVDDEPVFVELVSAILSASGYKCIGVGSGKEALKCLGEDPAPPVAMVDLKLPDCDGAVLIRQLRFRRPDLAVIAVSGSELPEHRQAAYAAGAFAFIPKPFKSANLITLLAEHGFSPETLNPAAEPAGP